MKSVEELIFPQNLPPLLFLASLVPAKDRSFLLCYSKWLILLANRGLGLKPVYEHTFNRFYRAVSHNWSEKTLLGSLQKEFIARNLSLSMLLEPVDGFAWLSRKRYTMPLDKATPILLQIITPLTRFIAVLNNQRPPFYQPCSHLFFAYLVLYVLNMPDLRELLAKSCIITDNKKLKQQLMPLLNEAKQTISVTFSLRFKFKIAYVLGLCRRLIVKNQQEVTNKLNFFDYVNAFLYGLWYTVITRDNSQELNKL